IGIGDYKSPWSDLPGATEDAREVAEKFQSIGWDTTLLENPTGTELKRSFNRLIAGPGRDSQKAILVWFSGHGYTLKQFDGTPSGYLVPSDAPDPELDEVGFRGTAMDMASIEQISKSILSKHVLMLFDSCFSGSLFTVSRSLKPSPYIQMKTLKPVRQFITAGQADEKVPDDSIFQKVFLQGLNDRYADLNRDGYVTGEELGSYLQEKVINYSNSTQHPQYAKINHYLLDKGDFVFVLPNAGLADVQDRRVRELELWINIRDSNDPKFFKDFLQRFPDGIYAGLAKVRLNNLLEPPIIKNESTAALTASLYGLGKSFPYRQFAIMLEGVFGIKDSEWIGGRLD
ncbi:MAG TPA: caspase family protein, partial [Gammaproteobacteria bacterium]|nr:caspase family protein [Gammaproteobacteria bacterium]